MWARSHDARALAQQLEARGHVVKLAASGRAVGILERHGLDVLRIDGMSMRFAEGAELRMLRLVLTGRMRAEVERVQRTAVWAGPRAAPRRARDHVS